MSSIDDFRVRPEDRLTNVFPNPLWEMLRENKRICRIAALTLFVGAVGICIDLYHGFKPGIQPVQIMNPSVSPRDYPVNPPARPPAAQSQSASIPPTPAPPDNSTGQPQLADESPAAIPVVNPVARPESPSEQFPNVLAATASAGNTIVLNGGAAMSATQLDQVRKFTQVLEENWSGRYHLYTMAYCVIEPGGFLDNLFASGTSAGQSCPPGKVSALRRSMFSQMKIFRIALTQPNIDSHRLIAKEPQVVTVKEASGNQNISDGTIIMKIVPIGPDPDATAPNF
jgi:hypothetical protein